jgi:hypothetical protein
MSSITCFHLYVESKKVGHTEAEWWLPKAEEWREGEDNWSKDTMFQIEGINDKYLRW